MNKIILIAVLIFGFFIGVIFSSLTLSISAKEAFIKEVKSPYDFEKTVRVIEDRINSKEGWHVTKVYDQNEEVIKGGAKAIGEAKIIKFCNAKLSSNMLSADDRKKMLPFMPLSIGVYEKSSGEVFISMKNGALMTKLLGGEIEDIAEQASREVEEIMGFMNFKFNIFN